MRQFCAALLILPLPGFAHAAKAKPKPQKPLASYVVFVPASNMKPRPTTPIYDWKHATIVRPWNGAQRF